MPADNVVDIDLNKLEEEWLRQPTMMQDACRRLAKARKRYSEAKARVDLTHARCSLKIRKTPRKYGITKVTEPVIKETILTLDEYRQAQQEMIDAKFVVDNLESLYNALEHRKRALENEVTLWSQGYFSTPRVRKDASEQVKEKIRLAEKRKLVAMGRDKK